MKYELKQIYCRPWLLNGLSLKLIESHYENNYGGALRRLNAITEQLEALDFANTPPYVVNGLKREELVALNSTLLHELYFASMAATASRPRDGGGACAATSARSTAGATSSSRWPTRLAGGSGGSCSSTCRATAGSSISTRRTTAGIAGGVPILALDMYEHAYHIDFGANAKAYIDASCATSTGRRSTMRYEDAKKVEPPRPLVQPEFGDLPGVGVEEVKAMLDAGQPVQVIDARPRHYRSRQSDIMDGAMWRDPERVQEWVGELSKSDPVVVFCAYGFHVGCKTAIALRDAGFDAKYMTGGHSGWRAIGGPTVPKGELTMNAAMKAMTVAQLSDCCTERPPPLVIDVRRARSFPRGHENDRRRAAARSGAAWPNGRRALPRRRKSSFTACTGTRSARTWRKRSVERPRGASSWKAGSPDGRRRAARATRKPRARARAGSRASVRRSTASRARGCLALRRPRRRVPLRADRGSAGRRESARRDPLRRTGRALLARRRALQLRRFHQALPAERSGARAARAIVRGADTGRLDLAPQAPGLARSRSASRATSPTTTRCSKHGMVMYDALYAWCKEGQDELHTWNPAAYV